MTNNNNKDIITNNILWIRQLFFSHVNFLISSEVSVAFNILFFHANGNLSNISFWHEQFSRSKYLSILHAQCTLTTTRTRITHTINLYKNPNHLMNHFWIHSWIHFCSDLYTLYSVHIYIHSIHAELKILFHISQHSIRYFYIHILLHSYHLSGSLPPYLFTQTING